jgi:hypothetical protein
MSAGSVGLFAPKPVRMPSRSLRPPPGVPEVPAREPGSGWHQTIRLTRRGRLTFAMMATVAVVMLAVVLATVVYAAGPQIDHTTTVSAGQTLSEVAATQLPSLTINNAVARIQLANGMNTLQVHAGQLLLIPAVP